MAIAAGTVWEINSAATASNVNGAGFNPTNANFATDLTTDANTANTNAPIVSSASYNFVAGDVGAWVYIKSGTNWTVGWYIITAVGSNKATLSATIGAAIQADATKGYPEPKWITNTVTGCATVGTPTSGTWGLDYSQGTAAIGTAADLAINAVTNTVVTSATRTFGVNDVGNHIHITAGTGFTVGWYEIISVAAGAATLDRSPGAVAITGGTWYEGGAASLNSGTDAAFFNTTNKTAGNIMFVAPGTVTNTGTVVVGAGVIGAPVYLIGYTTNRGTVPTGASRPTFATGANVFQTKSFDFVLHLIITGTGSNGAIQINSGTSGTFNCKIVNISTTAGRCAINSDGGDSRIVNCEAVSYRGVGIKDGAQSIISFSYVHDSDIGIDTTRGKVLGCIVESCVTNAIKATISTQNLVVLGCTLYGAENKLGVGLNIVSSGQSGLMQAMNNVFYGFTTAVSCDVSANQTPQLSDFNDYFNNTTDNTNWYKGPNDQAVDPAFTSVSQITGTAGKFRAGNDAIVDTTKNFTALGVVAGRDKIYIISGTGSSAGIYGVSSIATTTNPNDTLVLDLAPGTNTTADKAYQLTVGHNFYQKKFMAGFPGAFQASLTTGFSQIGAVPPARMMQHAAMQGGPN